MEITNKKKQYHSTSSMVYSCQYHIIWTTKYRRKVLTDKIQNRLKEIVFDIQDKYNFKVLEIETMPDHVHLLLDCNPNIGIYNIMNGIKGTTSRLLRKEFIELKTKLPTLWTRGKFISSVGSVSLDVVKKYIENQKNK